MPFKKLENEDAVFEIKNNILIGAFKREVIDLAIARKITNDRLEFQKGKLYPIVSNIKRLQAVTKEARDFLASEEGCTGVIAAAVLIDSNVGGIIGIFFILLSKPLRPTKIFSDQDEALKWLEQFKRE